MKTQIEIKDGVFMVKGNNAELLRAIVALTDEQGGALVTDYDGPKAEQEVNTPDYSVEDMRESLGSIMMEGKVVPYREVIEACSGNYFIHGYPGIEEVLESSTDPDFNWNDVVDFLCPIADEVLINAKEVNEEAYLELAGVIRKTYEMLKTTYEEEEVEGSENSRYIIVPNGDYDAMVEALREITELSSGGWNVEFIQVDSSGNTHIELTRSITDELSNTSVEVA